MTGAVIGIFFTSFPEYKKGEQDHQACSPFELRYVMDISAKGTYSYSSSAVRSTSIYSIGSVLMSFNMTSK